MEGSGNAIASGSSTRTGPPSTPCKEHGWSSIQGSPIKSLKKRNHAEIETDRVTRSQNTGDDEDDESEDDVQDSPSKNKGKGKAKKKKTVLSAQQQDDELLAEITEAKRSLAKVKQPSPTDPQEKHQEYLDAWCNAWLDKTGGNSKNRHYERPRLATPQELREGGKEAGTYWWMWLCKYCKAFKKLKLARDAGSGTNMGHRLEVCTHNPENIKKKQEGLCQTTLVSTTALSPEVRALETRHAIVAWISRNNHAFSVVDQPGFKEMFTRSFPALEQVLPSRRTVTTDLTLVHHVNSKRLGGYFKAYDGAFHIAVDVWTDRNNAPFLGVNCVWNVVEGFEVVPRSMLIDFINAPQRHTGEYLAKLLSVSLLGWGIQDKVISIICDNASANDVMVKRLAENEWERLTEGSRMRCFAHVINLIVGAIIEGSTGQKWSQDQWDEIGTEGIDAKVFNDPDVAHDSMEIILGEEPDDEDFLLDQGILDELELPCVPYTQDVTASQAVIPLAGQEGETAVSAEDQEKARMAQVTRTHQNIMFDGLRKCRILAKRLKYRTVWRRDWEAAATALFVEKRIPLGAKTIPIDVQTRWNSTWECIEACLTHEIVIKRFYTLLDVKEQPLAERLNAAEFRVLGSLEPVLKLLNACTKRFSKSAEAKVDGPFIAGVIPVMDALTGRFDRLRDVPGDEMSAIRKTDESVLYRIAMLLHPAYRVTYMGRAGWPEEWINEAKRLGREMWEGFYRLPEEQKAAQPNDQMPIDDLDALLDNALSQAPGAGEGPDEFDVFINGRQSDLKVPPFNLSALTWWAHQPTLGGLRSMALDVLGTPATSVEVERAFSEAGLMFSSRRTRLRPETSKEQMCVGDWMKHGFLSEKHFVEMFKKPAQKPTERKAGGTFKKPATPNAKKKKVDVIAISSSKDEDNGMDID